MLDAQCPAVCGALGCGTEWKDFSILLAEECLGDIDNTLAVADSALDILNLLVAADERELVTVLATVEQAITAFISLSVPDAIETGFTHVELIVTVRTIISLFHEGGFEPVVLCAPGSSPNDLRHVRLLLVLVVMEIQCGHDETSLGWQRRYNKGGSTCDVDEYCFVALIVPDVVIKAPIKAVERTSFICFTCPRLPFFGPERDEVPFFHCVGREPKNVALFVREVMRCIVSCVSDDVLRQVTVFFRIQHDVLIFVAITALDARYFQVQGSLQIEDLMS